MYKAKGCFEYENTNSMKNMNLGRKFSVPVVDDRANKAIWCYVLFFYLFEIQHQLRQNASLEF